MKTDIYIKNNNYEHELIKKSDIIDVVEDITWYSQNRNKDMVSGASNTHEAWYKADDIYNALKSIPPSNDGEMVLIEGDGIFDYYGLLDALLNNGYVVKIKKMEHAITLNIKWHQSKNVINKFYKENKSKGMSRKMKFPREAIEQIKRYCEKTQCLRCTYGRKYRSESIDFAYCTLQESIPCDWDLKEEEK